MTVLWPNYQDTPNFIAMAVRDYTDYYAMSSAAQGTGVVSGCAVVGTGSTVGGFAGSVTVALGEVCLFSSPTSIYTGSTINVVAASTTDRRDVVVWRQGTGFTILAGTPCGTANWVIADYPATPPVKPDINPSTDVVLAEIYIEGSGATPTTSISATPGINTVDKRNMLFVDPLAVPSIGGTVSGTLTVSGPLVSAPTNLYLSSSFR